MIAASEVSAILVTRGDVDTAPSTDTLTAAGITDIVVWDNSKEWDHAVYGRYMAEDRCANDVILVQDDDVILPTDTIRELLDAYEPGVIVANMPERFRHDFYSDHCLVGLGAIYDGHLPGLAFDRFGAATRDNLAVHPWPTELFMRTCDVIFTTLTPYKLLDHPYVEREFASDDTRMWQQPDHVAERARMLELARQVRDAAPG